MHTDHLPTPICPHCCNPVTEHAYECIGIEARKRQDITEGASYLLEARGILDALQEPAETKSDQEIEVTASTALAAFWSAVLNRHPGNAVLEGDVLIRLEIAAYDAVEAWRAENPQTVAPFGWEPAPQWAKDAKDQDSR